MSEEPEPYIAYPGDISDFPEARRRRAIMDALRSRQPPPPPPPVTALPDRDVPLVGGKARHNVFIAGRRTSLRLELPAWEALVLVAALERVALEALLTDLDRLRAPGACGLSEAVRCYPLIYLRRLAGM